MKYRIAYTSLVFNLFFWSSLFGQKTLHPSAQRFLNTAVLYHDQGDYESALSYYNSALRIEPAHIDGIFNRGLVFQALDLTELALKDFERVAELNPLDKEANELIQVLSYTRESYNKGDFLLESLLAESSDESEVIEKGGSGHTKLSTNGRPDVLDVVGSLDQEFPEELKLVHLYLKDNLIEDALKLASTYISAYPDDPIGYRERSLAHFLLGDVISARNDINTALALNPQSGESHYLKASYYYNDRSYLGAIEHLKEALTFMTNTDVGLELLALCYMKIKDLPKAKTCLDNLLESTPDNTNALSNRGSLKVNVGDLWGAIEDYSAAITVDHANPTHFINRSRAYQALCQYDKALTDCNRALELSPQTPKHWVVFRSEIRANQGDYRGQIRDITYALKIAKHEEASLYLDRATAYHKLGEHERAKNDYDRAIKLDPENSLSFYNRSVLFKEMGLNEMAIYDLRRAQRLGMDLEATALNVK